MLNPDHIYLYFLAGILLTILVSVLIRDRRMITMSLVLLATWALSNLVSFNLPVEYWRTAFFVLNVGTFIALIIANRGGNYDPNLWAFVAIFFDGLMIPSHLPMLYDWLGPYYHSLWVNLCFASVIAVLFIGACHRLWLDLYWRFWKYPRLQTSPQEDRE